MLAVERRTEAMTPQRRAPWAVAAVVVAFVGVVTSVFAMPAPRALASSPDVERTVGGAGTLGAVTVIGDSVLYGSKDSLPEALVAAGFGPVRYRAGLGYSTGNRLPAGHDSSVANWISWWRAEGWDPPTLLVNLGANDVGFCDNTDGCETAVRYLMERIGTTATVLWPMISHFYEADSEMWNAALDRVAADYPNLVLWDWPAARVAAGIPIAWDNIHLPHSGAYAQRSALLAEALVAAVSGSEPSGQPPVVPAAAGEPSTYVPLPPARVLDTRSAGKVAAGTMLTVDLNGSVPAGATAAAVNLTAVDADAAGYLTAWPCGAGRPDVSSVNFTTSGARGAHAVVPLTGGQLCVYSPVTTNVIVDLQGAFVPTGAEPEVGLRYEALIEPGRLVDTRTAERLELITISAPPGAVAVTVNLTATAPLETGYLSAYPCGGGVPGVSNVNFTPGETVAGSAYVPVNASGTFCVATVGRPHVLVDLTGVFGPSGTLAFTPAAPVRVLDTRAGTGGWIGRLGAAQHIRAAVTPPGASAVTGTITAVDAGAEAFVSVAAALPAVPATSNVNVGRNTTIANSVTTSVAADSSLEAFASAPLHLLFDVTGWWSP
jgi:hypothetical protein